MFYSRGWKREKGGQKSSMGSAAGGQQLHLKVNQEKKKSQSGKIVQRELILVIYQFQILLILLLNVSFFFPG